MSQLQLTDAQKRDILTHLEHNKPLPEEYRFQLFDNKNQVELVRNGKTNTVSTVALPFQTIEIIDEPRVEKSQPGEQVGLFDMRGRQQSWWTNKLIRWDNKLILSSLLYGPMRDEIKKAWWLKLIYIDPPFDVGADFSMKIELWDDEYTKSPSILEEIAYRDTWGKGADSFISMIYERLRLMKDLLADDGSIYVHCDWRVNSHIRLILDEIFGKDNFRNEIIWEYQGSWVEPKTYFPRRHNSILFYKKNNNEFFNRQYEDDWDNQINSKRWQRYIVDGKIYWNNYPSDDLRFKTYFDKFVKSYWRLPNEKDVVYEVTWSVVWSVWYIKKVDPKSPENLDYPTQKAESLLSRIIETSSNPWDLVADFFCGSWTTLAVAEKLGRKWIGSDLGKFGVHTTRKRMVAVQRELLASGQDYRAFEILNLGQYERSFFVGKHLEGKEHDSFSAQLDQQKIYLYTELVTSAYKASGLAGYSYLHARKENAVVSIGPIDFPVDHAHIMQAVSESLKWWFTQLHVLWFEFAMGATTAVEQAKAQWISLHLKYIPRDVFDKRVIADDAVKFFDVAYIEAKATKVWHNTVWVSLTDFAVYYTQDNLEQTIDKIKKKNWSKEWIIMRDGNIFKIKFDDAWNLENEVNLTKTRTDWIDYWAVDFDYTSKKEIVRVMWEQGEETGMTGRYVFENERQSFKTKKNKDLELMTAHHIYESWGTKTIAIKVVDIFGNDNMTTIQVKL